MRGVSLGGVYTSLLVPELHALFDVGIAPRSFASAGALFLSHAHADHVGALVSLLGVRGLTRGDRLPVYMPEQVVEPLVEALAAMSHLQGHELAIEPIGMKSGDELPYRGDIRVRAFRTYHRVPSLAYQFVRRINKLRPAFHGLDGSEIGRRRKAGDDIFDIHERLDFAYATDTLVRVLDEVPSLYQTRVLVLECSFLDERKTLAATREGCHIHLDEILERADMFENEHLVLMHFSQLYQPAEVRHVLNKRCPPKLLQRIVPFVSQSHQWPG